MQMIPMTPDTLALLRDLALFPFRSTAVEQPDGSMAVPCDDDVVARLDAARFPGESYDDTISRLVRSDMGRKLN